MGQFSIAPVFLLPYLILNFPFFLKKISPKPQAISVQIVREF